MTYLGRIDRNALQAQIDRCWHDPIRAQRLATILTLLEAAADLEKRAEKLFASLEPERLPS